MSSKKLTSVVLLGAGIISISCIIRRARNSARNASQCAQVALSDGSLISYYDPLVRRHVLNKARRRSNKEIIFEKCDLDEKKGQVGGLSKHKKRFLSLYSKYVLKPIQVDHRGIREVAFYEAVTAGAEFLNKEDCLYDEFMASIGLKKDKNLLDVVVIWVAHFLQDPEVRTCEKQIARSYDAFRHEARLLGRLQDLIPTFYGIWQPNISLKEKLPLKQTPYLFDIDSDSYLHLDDVTKDFTKPSVIDLKIGTQSYEPDAPIDKQVREQKKYPAQTKFGFRIVGMTVYDPSLSDESSEEYNFYGKDFGRSLLTREELKKAFKLYFGLGANQEQALKIKSQVIYKTISKLHTIKTWFLENDVFRFYASSILIVHEGDVSNDLNQNSVEVKMIDFGRVRRESNRDEGFLVGLDHILEILNDLLQDLI